MAQDNTPAIVMYKGPQADGYSIPFDKGFYGEAKVAFVRRGLTDYEYNPTTYTVDGELYAWEISTGIYYYTKSASPAVDATVYDSGNHEISGVKVVSTQNASASFSDGKTGVRSNKKDIHSHALLFWTGEPLGDDDWICIVRETVKKQPYSYPNNQKHIEGALDNLSRQIQELKAQSDVSLKVDPTFVQDPQKMNPIDWLNTIVRSTDTTARGLRYRNFWLEYSTDDPNKTESDKSWTKLLNTTNITSVREWYDEDNKVYIPQYSMDGGLTWKALGAVHLIEDVQEQIDELKENVYTKTQVDGKFSATNAAVDANADAIQKTREDYINADSEIHQILNNHAENLTTLHNDVDNLGDQVSGIEEKIPESASGSNPLITKQQLLDEEMDIREDLNSGLSELQTQITHQAAAIAGKQDELIAGDNIIISGNVISATGAGGGVGFDIIVVQELPESGEKGIIYLVPKDSAVPDIYDEYVWVTTTSTFELIGSTKVDLTGYVKDTDYATSSKGGVIRTNSTYGAWSGSNGLLTIVKAPDETILEKTHLYQPIVPASLDYAVKVGVTTNTIELTDNEKTAARTWLGAVGGTDYATETTGGVMKVASTNGLYVNPNTGIISGNPIALSAYDSFTSYGVIAKGTLENIKYDLVKQGVTASTIELTDEEKAAAQAWLGVSGGTKVIFREWEE